MRPENRPQTVENWLAELAGAAASRSTTERRATVSGEASLSTSIDALPTAEPTIGTGARPRVSRGSPPRLARRWRALAVCGALLLAGVVLSVLLIGGSSREFRLGERHYYGNGTAQDYSAAVKWYRKAADQGHARAQYKLGWMYDNGEGVPRDHGEAAVWYRKAADQGLADAQLNLGRTYHSNGEGVPQDHGEAAVWYRKAADQGLADAQLILGWMYSNGEGVPQDHGEAAVWYRKAADQGSYWPSQIVLAHRYADGDGVPQDYVRAYAYLNILAAQGYGLDEKDRIGRQMTREQIAEAQRLSRDLVSQ